MGWRQVIRHGIPKKEIRRTSIATSLMLPLPKIQPRRHGGHRQLQWDSLLEEESATRRTIYQSGSTSFSVPTDSKRP